MTPAMMQMVAIKNSNNKQPRFSLSLSLGCNCQLGLQECTLCKARAVCMCVFDYLINI